jgi:VanZ family protein
VVAWASIIWILGGETFSAAFTAKVLRPLIELFVNDFSSGDMFSLLTVVRKGMHVAVYGLLALLTIRALWIGSVDSLVLSLSLTSLFVGSLALADEIRQGQVEARTGSGWDVLLDLLGAAMVLTLLVALRANRRSPLFAPEPAESQAAAGGAS